MSHSRKTTPAGKEVESLRLLLRVCLVIVVLAVIFGVPLLNNPSPPENKDACKSICAPTSYTCKDGKRDSMTVTVINGTTKPRELTLTTEGEGAVTPSETFTLSPQDSRLFTQPAKQGVPFKIRVTSDGIVIGVAEIRAEYNCQKGDPPAPTQ